MSEILSVCKGTCPTVFKGASQTADELRTTLQKLELAVSKVSHNVLRVKKEMEALQKNPDIQKAFYEFSSKNCNDEELKENVKGRSSCSVKIDPLKERLKLMKERKTLILTDPAFVTYLYSVIPQSTAIPLLKRLSKQYLLSIKRLNSLQIELDAVINKICALK